MTSDALEAAAALLGLDTWEGHRPLSGGRGATSLAWHGTDRYVVKAYRSGGARGAREVAALGALGGAAGVPRLVAASDDPPCAVLTVLAGDHSLADTLLGQDAARARRDLIGWAEALAAVHEAGTPQVRVTFRDRLQAAAPDLPAHALPGDFAAAADAYERLIQRLGLPPHREALRDLRGLPATLEDPAYEVLSPADTCPDNNLVEGNRVRLLDFEYAELRHAAWDLAYVRAPWPSCWCSWRLPDAEAGAAVERYLELRGPAWARDRFRSDLATATRGWQVMTPAFFVEGALEDPDDELARDQPARRAFVLHRLAAAAHGRRDALAVLAHDLHQELRRRWGPVPLRLAPAFRDESLSVGP